MTSDGRPCAVTLDSVALTYPGRPPVEALKPVSLEVEAGDFVAVVGPSGSGKSTLLNVLGLLDRPTHGVYRLQGIDVGTLSEAERAAVRGRWIGFVFQSFHLLDHRSAVENVALALLYAGVPRDERIWRATDALTRIGLGHRMHALPSALSGGERQRVAIARAVVSRPTLLLCDEPTGNLDSRNAGAVMRLLVDLNRDGQTIVVITHDERVAAAAKRRLVIVDGEVSERMTVAPAASPSGPCP